MHSLYFCYVCAVLGRLLHTQCQLPTIDAKRIPSKSTRNTIPVASGARAHASHRAKRSVCAERCRRMLKRWWTITTGNRKLFENNNLTAEPNRPIAEQLNSWKAGQARRQIMDCTRRQRAPHTDSCEWVSVCPVCVVVDVLRHRTPICIMESVDPDEHNDCMPSWPRRHRKRWRWRQRRRRRTMKTVD